MRRRSILTAVAPVVLFVALHMMADASLAAVTLISAQMSGSWGNSYFVPGSPPFSSSGTYGPDPFPNDDLNFAGVTQEGLKVLVNRTGRFSGNTSMMGSSRQWDDPAFSVVFDLDRPAAFTYHGGALAGGMVSPVPTLEAQGKAAVALQPIGLTSGVLPAGHYSYFGGTVAHTLPPPTDGPFSYEVAFTDSTLVVTPEPAGAALLMAPLLLCLRRRRPAPAADRVGLRTLVPGHRSGMQTAARRGILWAR